MVKNLLVILVGLFLLVSTITSFVISSSNIFFFELNILVCAFLVIFAKNPVNALYFLISVFLNTSIVLVCVNIEFLAIVFVIVYIGAISVFFLFMIMLVNISPQRVKLSLIQVLAAIGYWIVVLSTGFLVISRYGLHFLNLQQQSNYNFTAVKFGSFEFSKSAHQLIGHFFYTYYAFPLILLGSFLLIIMIGVIIFPNRNVTTRSRVPYSNAVFLKIDTVA
jgi:NADH-quinone oxidoreductase subunit J